MRRNLYLYFYVCLSQILLATLIVPNPSPLMRASAQDGVKRWVIIYHQQNSIPADADSSVEQAGGAVTKRLPEVGALVAESSNPNFAAEMASDPKVSDFNGTRSA